MRTQIWMRVLAQLIALFLSRHSVVAQVVPDQTLPVGERSQVSGTLNTQIDGGATRGSNLFHSFQQFSIPTGGSVFFNNPISIANIITRATGNNPSSIDGMIRANGSTNFFLINPNGIVFGANARLQIGGSFLATTATSLKFADGFEFSASNPQASPLLMISTPTGLQTGTSPGAIRVQGQGSGQGGLAVGTGKTLAVVGGDVRLEGGNLSTPGGRIELGSVAGGSAIALTPDPAGWSLNYSGARQFQDIVLTQAARVDASGNGGGRIQLQGRRLSLTEGSQILTETQGTQAGRDLTIRATESVDVSGSNSQDEFSSLITQVNRGSTGNGGNLTIDTGAFRVAEGAIVSTSTLGAGKGGDLTVRAQSVEVISSTSLDGFATFLITQANRDSIGNAGNLTIDAGTFRVAEGSVVSTRTFGAGKGGDITVRAQSAEVLGSIVKGLPSAVSSAAGSGSTGNAGNIIIDAGTFRMAKGALVFTSTSGAGKGGDITVRAQSVEITDLVGSAVTINLATKESAD